MEPDAVARLHLLDALAALPLVPASVERACDLGSGGGVPGIVLALDDNWFAFASLTIAFLVVVGIGVIVLMRHSRSMADAHAATRANE